MLAPRSTISESCFTSPARTASCMLPKWTFFLAPTGAAVSAEEVAGPGRGTPGMVCAVGLRGGAEPRPSSLAVAHETLQRPSSCCPRPGPPRSVARGQEPAPPAPPPSLSPSQEPAGRGLESRLPLRAEDSLSAKPSSSLSPSHQLLRLRPPSALPPSQASPRRRPRSPPTVPPESLVWWPPASLKLPMLLREPWGPLSVSRERPWPWPPPSPVTPSGEPARRRPGSDPPRVPAGEAAVLAPASRGDAAAAVVVPTDLPPVFAPSVP